MTRTRSGRNSAMKLGPTISWPVPTMNVPVLFGIHVDGELHLGADAERREEGDALRAPAPHHDPSPAQRRRRATSPGTRPTARAPGDGTCRTASWIAGRSCSSANCRPLGRLRQAVEHDVLVRVLEAQLDGVEAVRTEQPGQRAGREVRAVLVVDVPERASSSTRRTSGSSKNTSVSDRSRTDSRTAATNSPTGPMCSSVCRHTTASAVSGRVLRGRRAR